MAMSAGKREMDNLRRLLAQAKAEDLGSGDVTGELLPADLGAEARFVARSACRDVEGWCAGVSTPDCGTLKRCTASWLTVG